MSAETKQHRHDIFPAQPDAMLQTWQGSPTARRRDCAGMRLVPFLDHEYRVTTQFSPRNDRQITTAALHSLSFTLRTTFLVQ